MINVRVSFGRIKADLTDWQEILQPQCNQLAYVPYSLKQREYSKSAHKDRQWSRKGCEEQTMN